ncbi:hypothetical protein KCP70_23350 [Salmonella enterica subsp. enterica]|nr:hypothetical protein KCP70_23350 [Salmonella enterica subsp. enterica]
MIQNNIIRQGWLQSESKTAPGGVWRQQGYFVMARAGRGISAYSGHARGEASTRSHWQPLATHSFKQLPCETFHIQPLDSHRSAESLTVNASVITNLAHGSELNSRARRCAG